MSWWVGWGKGRWPPSCYEWRGLLQCLTDCSPELLTTSPINFSPPWNAQTAKSLDACGILVYHETLCPFRTSSNPGQASTACRLASFKRLQKIYPRSITWEMIRDKATKSHQSLCTSTICQARKIQEFCLLFTRPDRYMYTYREIESSAHEIDLESRGGMVLSSVI